MDVNSAPPEKKEKAKWVTKTWFPAVSPLLICGCYLSICLVFAAIGIVLLIISMDMTEVEFEYTNACSMTALNTTGAPYCFVSQKKITIPRKMNKPVYLYYKLENVYQNYRKYVTNLNDAQLSGSTSPPTSSCDPFRMYNDSSYYNPCGTIPYSMFNDTFKLYNSDNQVVCNGVDPTGSNCTKNNIVWPIDRNYRFKLPSNPNDPMWVMYNQSYKNEDGHMVPRTNDEDLMVWMRLAALPFFRKLYRIINVDLQPGDYYFDIEQRWPVRADLGVRKKLVLANGSWFGGKNMFLAIAYLSVSGLCLIFGLLFGVAWIVQKLRERRIVAEIKRARQNAARRSARLLYIGE